MIKTSRHSHKDTKIAEQLGIILFWTTNTHGWHPEDVALNVFLVKCELKTKNAGIILDDIFMVMQTRKRKRHPDAFDIY